MERRAELSGFADGVKVGCERKTGLWGWGCYILRWRTVGKECVLLNALVIKERRSVSLGSTYQFPFTFS